MRQYLKWTVCLLLAASCSGPKSVSPQDVAETLKLKDYEPVSVFRLEEHHPSAAKFSAIDFHSHAYRKDEAGIREWVKILDDNNIEKVIVYTYAFGEEFDRLYDLFTGISDKFEVWCGLDMTKWDHPEFPDCALKELERCHAKGAGGVGELSDKGENLQECAGTRPAFQRSEVRRPLREVRRTRHARDDPQRGSGLDV